MMDAFFGLSLRDRLPFGHDVLSEHIPSVILRKEARIIS